VDAASAVEEDAHGLAVAFFYLAEYLSADAAGGDGLCGELSAGVARGHADGLYGLVGIAAIGVEYGGALGACACGEGGVLLVAAAHDGAIGEEYGCAYGEVAEW